MKIQELLPVDLPPNLSGLVSEELVVFLDSVRAEKHFDVKAAMMSVKIIAAFAALEREGTIESFRSQLWR